jgi:hypothetical protein
MKTLIRFFNEYKNSINWVATLAWFLVFTLGSQLDGLSLRNFLLVILVFIVMTLCVWFQNKYIYNKKTSK